ncbi:ribonuclease E/G [Sphingomonas sp. ST-64]|uniref:Ribonuclease E n=1 Tax=Sphingomonas plantiphila TaxID=3163295 RepID=A0ABW8YJY7_9SPHN
MTMRMLIDARHREETRVAVVKGNRIEEFDFESAERKQLKGNIYLAKVTRVEPSLQAAFVEYGGNRHGFLAFSEIHPDYYQIPKEDRDALLREEAEHAAEEAALREEADGDEDHDDEDGEVEVLERPADEDEEHAEAAEGDAEGEGESGKGGRRRRGRKGNDDQVEALRQRRMSLRRRYKIQDVIRRRQVLLVQVVKEERGNKGAALTTYLSLAGRYCVLMPNTAHGGGISRKISSAADRKRLKTIMADMKLPPSMGCIVRTAGLQRTKTEIKRDFDYLARLWDEIRDKTLQSSAPALVYGDSDLMKRAIRDIYNKDIDEVIVEGDDGYRQAKDFMKLLMPSHAKKVKHYSDAVPLFQRAGVEEQLSAMYHPVVQLKSGGYLVINPTEALVSIDINSGRSTREHSIEQTATATNLEAAQEIARQLRLRDMAGLVVIDFIDMDHSSNVRKVEKAMKEALKNDRARIQVGRISAFGLMEMSRQRLRTGVLEASTRQCPHCEGTGLVRTASSAGLSALRLIEDEAARGRGSVITLRCSQEAAFYVLNKKRADIAEIEDRYGVSVEILSDGELEGARMSVEADGPPPAHAPKFAAAIEEIEEDFVEEIDEEEEEEEVEARAPRERRERDDGEGEGGRKRRRRRRGRRNRREDGDAPQGVEGEQDGDADGEGDDSPRDGESEVAAEASGADGEGEGRKRRRRGRRGGRRGAGAGEDSGAEAAEDAGEGEAVVEAQPEDAPVAETGADAEEAPAKPKRTRRKKADAEPVSEAAEAAPEAPVEAPSAEEAPAKPKRTRRKKAEEAPAAEAAPIEAPIAAPVAADEEAAEAPAKPKRTRRKKAEAAPVEEVSQDLDATAPAGDVAPEDAPSETSQGEGEAGAPRRGWWQRTFGA